MSAYQRKDHYYKKAKEEGLASRASFKLEEIQKKYRIFKHDDRVVDLGCAPGGWMQVASRYIEGMGRIVGIDLLPINIPLASNMFYIEGDITDPTSLKAIREQLEGNANVIISDMAPNLSGVRFKDAYASYELCTMALDVCHKLLHPGGNFVAKIFEGDELPIFKKECQEFFQKVIIYVPKATRRESSENYCIGLGYKGKDA